jgi:hypothetical protein
MRNVIRACSFFDVALKVVVGLSTTHAGISRCLAVEPRNEASALPRVIGDRDDRVEVGRRKPCHCTPSRLGWAAPDSWAPERRSRQM